MKALILFFIVFFTISQSYGAECPEDPCSKYRKPCTSDEECGEKYFNCLEPKAGIPNILKKNLCTKTGKENIQLELAEWKGKPGQNQLLCSFFENDFLMQFATSVKHVCKAGLASRQKELEKAGYSCTLLEETSNGKATTEDNDNTGVHEKETVEEPPCKEEPVETQSETQQTTVEPPDSANN